MGFRKSEYSRQYKEPSWDTYQDYYQEQVSYRAYRRQLEHHHNFVEWDWDTESETGNGEDQEGGGRGMHRPQPIPRATRSQDDREERGGSEGEEIAARGLSDKEVQTPDRDDDWPSGRRRDRGSKKRSRSERKVQETSPSSLRPKTSPEKSRRAGLPRPPMVAFGWADRNKDIGCKKTFNIKASAHGDNSQVFPAALRAMKRNEYAIKYREEQRRRENLKAQRSRAIFSVPPPDDSMWTTEYRRNYSVSGTPTR